MLWLQEKESMLEDMKLSKDTWVVGWFGRKIDIYYWVLIFMVIGTMMVIRPLNNLTVKIDIKITEHKH